MVANAQSQYTRVDSGDSSAGLLGRFVHGSDAGREGQRSRCDLQERGEVRGDLRLAGSSDWGLASLEELEGIYDKDANASGLMGPSGKGIAAKWHLKGNLFLTGN